MKHEWRKQEKTLYLPQEKPELSNHEELLAKKGLYYQLYTGAFVFELELC